MKCSITDFLQRFHAQGIVSGTNVNNHKYKMADDNGDSTLPLVELFVKVYWIEYINYIIVVFVAILTYFLHLLAFFDC